MRCCPLLGFSFFVAFGRSQTSLKVMAGILEAGLSSRCSGFYWWLSKMSSPCLAKPGRCSSPVDLEGASDASPVGARELRTVEIAREHQRVPQH